MDVNKLVENMKNAVPRIDWLEHYFGFTETCAQYPKQSESVYLVLGIGNEIAEFMDTVFEVGTNIEERRLKSLDELGDVYWYLVRYGKLVLGYDLLVYGDRALSELKHNLARSIAKIGKDPKAVIIDMITHLNGLSGKLLGFEKKKMRDGNLWTQEKRDDKTREAKEAFEKMMLAISVIGLAFGMLPNQICDMNRAKLSTRLDNGTIRGDGDKR